MRRGWGSLTEVRELDGDAEVALAEEVHDRLQLVLLLAGDPELVALDRDLHLQLRLLGELRHLARLVRRDALLPLDALRRRPGRPGLDRAPDERPERDLAARHLLPQDVAEGPRLVVLGGEQV